MSGSPAPWFEPAVRLILAACPVMTLATSSPDGPWAADVYFAADGLALYFLSSPRSRHCRDLATGADCAATVHPVPPRSWREITGLQMSGRAGPVTGVSNHATGMRAYLARFAFAGELLSHPQRSGSLAAGARLYVFAPAWVRLIDNAHGFGRPLHATVTASGRLGQPTREEPTDS